MAMRLLQVIKNFCLIKKNKEMLSGYPYNNKVVHFKGDESLIGKIVKVKITENHLYSLLGEIVDE